MPVNSPSPSSIESLVAAFHDDMDGKIVCVTSRPSALELQLEIDSFLMPVGACKAVLTCLDPKAFDVTPGFVDSLGYSDDHPLLSAHSGPQSQLFFSSAPSSPAEVFYVAHKTLEAEFSGWSEPAHYLNGDAAAFGDFLSGGYGLLASGPHRAMQALANAVGPLLRINLIESHTLSAPVSVLTLGRQFVVCRSVEVVVDGSWPMMEFPV